ncbi:uncharacterized protein LOC134233469 [Saccostrea cucullata]|uniref:uncharacterized protein LOC134233469 n=1 Tax=Saccostrea cuccullata TaxID=36930 RepID=UPI002ED4E306
MGIVPKADTPADLEKWMIAYLETKEGKFVKAEAKEQQEHPQTEKQKKYIIQPPRFSVFTGNDKKGSETTFDLWIYEVQCLIRDKTHSDEDIAQAVRRSLRGEAGRVIMNLGPDANLNKILAKLTSVYGDIQERETILGEFYGTKQAKDEDVSSWSCRLENIMQKAIKIGAVNSAMADEMLHDMLYKGLKPELKAICHYEKERFKGFDELRVALRKLEKENEIDVGSRTAHVKQAVVQEKDEVQGMLKQITHRLNNLELQSRGRSQFRGSANYRTRNRGCFRGRNWSYPRRSEGEYRSQQQDQRDPSSTASTFSSQQNQQFAEVVCRRCGREGHIERGCRAHRDISGKPLTLNFSKSMRRGRP